MTPGRKKAILYLILTLILGILLGSLVPGFFGRFRKSDRAHDRRRGGLTHLIYRVVRPDSSQAAKIKPMIDQTSGRIDELQNGCNHEVNNLMDSLRIQLQPILSAEQLTKLEGFLNKGKEHWKGR